MKIILTILIKEYKSAEESSSLTMSALKSDKMYQKEVSIPCTPFVGLSILNHTHPVSSHVIKITDISCNDDSMICHIGDYRFPTHELKAVLFDLYMAGWRYCSDRSGLSVIHVSQS